MDEKFYHGWLPNLFSALGAGFSKDETLNQGQHLRWAADPRLGLPLVENGVEQGVVSIFRLKNFQEAGEDFPRSLHKTDLFDDRANRTYDNIVRTESQLKIDRDPDRALPWPAFHFVRDIGNDRRYGAFMAHLGIQESLKTHLEGGLEPPSKLWRYLEGINEAMRPNMTDWAEEKAEVVAVDVELIPIKGFPKVGAEKNSTNLISSILTDQQPIRFAYVHAYNRNNQRIASDWVGLEGIPPGVKKGVRAPKTIARLRAPGIERITIERLPKQPLMARKRVRFLFCDDYCNADIWEPVPGGRLGFETDRNAYPEAQIEYLHRPFKADFDAASIAEEIQSPRMLGLPQMGQIAQADNSFDAYSVGFGGNPNWEENREGNENFPPPTQELNMSLLAGLAGASIDPLIARVLGMYYYIEPTSPNTAVREGVGVGGTFPKDGDTDYMMRGNLPFFRPGNLTSLREAMLELYPEGDGPPNGLEEVFLKFQSQEHGTYVPAGLVLAPAINPKPSPIVGELNVDIRTTLLPSNENPDQLNLVVSSRVAFEGPGEATLAPWLHPVAFETESRLGKWNYQNTLADGEDGVGFPIGLLPPVTIPVRGETGGQVRHFFRLENLRPTTLQYRLRGFDIFGRPSEEETSDRVDLKIPCLPPEGLMNVIAEVVAEGSNLKYSTHFSLSSQLSLLSAKPKQLEMLAYPIPEGEGGARTYRWNNQKPGLRWTWDLDDPGRLNLHSGDWDAVDLSWEDEILKAEAGAAELLFPKEPVVLEEGAQMDYLNENEGQVHYQLQLPLGSWRKRAPGEHRWAMVLRVVGACDDHDHFSDTTYTSGRFEVPEPPTQTYQPPLDRVPRSTHSDRLGKAYFRIDLRPCLVPNAQAPDPPDDEYQVRLFQCTLDRLTDNPEEYVKGDFFTEDGVEKLLELARKSSRVFESLETLPQLYSAENRWYRASVPGDLSKIYLIGVQGVDWQMRARSWKESAFYIFRTPEPPPALYFRNTNSLLALNAQQESEVELTYMARLPEAIPNRRPKIQVLRHDLTLGTRKLVHDEVGEEYLPPQEEEANSELPEGGRYFRFQVEDRPEILGRSYRYETTLLYPVAHGNHYLKYREKSETTLRPLIAPEQFESAELPPPENHSEQFAPEVHFFLPLADQDLRLRLDKVGVLPEYRFARIDQGVFQTSDLDFEASIVLDADAGHYRLKLPLQWEGLLAISMKTSIGAAASQTQFLEL